MREIITTIDIAASPERVWRVLTDFASYPKWNPFIRGIHGNLEEGARLRVRMRLPPRGRARIFSPIVLKAIPAAELRWRGKLFMEGLFDGEHIFIIVPQGLEGARFIQRERFSGLLAPLLLLFIAGKTHKSFEAMNRALKKAAEVKS
ncbi:MAG TPA: SRPBCC domain-containing protein [Acidiferrobacterales bacterium]|nr:SRPBCC domain-containing protein [Acidiferrobacterales bacterium]